MNEKRKEYFKQYYIDNKEKIDIQNSKYYENNKENMQEKHRIYYEINKNEIKQYQEGNKENIQKYQKKYRKINKEKLTIDKKIYYKEKRNNDVFFKLKTNISRNIHHALKKQASSKNNESCLKYLSYSIIDLKQHLEALFESWMNWENYGRYHSNDYENLNDNSKWKWQIDHIIPQADLPYTSMTDENFKKCWDLENLRPLRADINMKDGQSKIRHAKNIIKLGKSL